MFDIKSTTPFSNPHHMTCLLSASASTFTITITTSHFQVAQAHREQGFRLWQRRHARHRDAATLALLLAHKGQRGGVCGAAVEPTNGVGDAEALGCGDCCVSVASKGEIRGSRCTADEGGMGRER